MKRVSNRFTLIEMLAVVAIASILIALITPAVQNLMFGSRVDQCASNFKLGLEQAQSKAIAARKYVALVLPFNHSASSTYNIYCRGGYRMAYVTRNGDDYDFDRWVENLDWKNPNAGALCMDVTTDSPDGNAANRLNWANDVKSRMKDLQQDKGFNVLSDLKNITNDNTPELVHLTNDGGSGKYCAVIFSPYGGIVNNERPLYFTFTEAKVGSDSKYELDNIDNFLVLKLNAITGQVTYFDPYDEAADD